MTAPQIRVASAQSTVRTAVARALATALVTGIDNAAEEGRPLSQLQQIDLAVSHVMAYQEAMDGCEAVEVDAALGRLVVPTRQPWQAAPSTTTATAVVSEKDRR